MLFLVPICCYRTEAIKSGDDKGGEAIKNVNETLEFSKVPTILFYIQTQTHSKNNHAIKKVQKLWVS